MSSQVVVVVPRVLLQHVDHMCYFSCTHTCTKEDLSMRVQNTAAMAS